VHVADRERRFRDHGYVVSGLRERARRFLQRPGTADLGRYRDLLPEIADREKAVSALTDDELTPAAGAETSDAAICALGREAARRGLGERPFDVQLLGTLVMLSGQVAEMATGEGKTLSGAMAAAGFAQRGRSVHVMSVNDYLARRDAEWMRPVYDLLGVSVGWIGQASTPAERRQAYAAQVTYGAVSEFGFDVLRDRLAVSVAGRVAGAPDVALIDEADSVLVDEALVPLVLAGAVDSGDAGLDMAEMVRWLRRGRDYQTDEDGRNVHLTDRGTRAIEATLGIDLYAEQHLDTLTRVNVALHAEALLRRDVEYIVRDGRIHLINASRGRVARLQRWPDGLHAAVEAKEGLRASRSGEILDSITIQALVGRYPAVCGMTGTAVAVGEQLREFYRLEIAVIPPNRRCVRVDEADRLYATTAQKEKALAGHVAAVHATGRPVLIGTLDVAESERIADRLSQAGLICDVLNAKNDAEEAAIVAEAGTRGAITVSTQMAGRGTDIRLGGAAGDQGQVAALGGLCVIGIGRHASSRLDHQLRGRAGRQGDPGSSVFFTSLQDELVARYAPEAMTPTAAAAADGSVQEPAAHETVGHAQRVAEGVNLEIHRTTWRYSKLVDDQRHIVLAQRDRVLRTDAALRALARRRPDRFAQMSTVASDDVLVDAARQITLWHLDREWADHLGYLADLREGIHLRALGRGLSPLDEFHKEAIRMFSGFLGAVEDRVAETFASVPVTADGADLSAAGLKRPSATWTYLVQENPFGTDIDRALRGVARALRRRGQS
jgi:preprotein translocase subunit SecA